MYILKREKKQVGTEKGAEVCLLPCLGRVLMEHMELWFALSHVHFPLLVPALGVGPREESPITS